MDTLQNVRLFMRVVREGSFTRVAEQADLTPGAVSRAVSQLEAHLRTRLLHRTTRHISLTPAGERYHARLERVMPALDEAEAEARNTSREVSGTLRLHAPTGIGVHYLVPTIARYRKAHADVEIELTLSHRPPDLVRDGYDLAIVLANELPDSSMVSRRLGTTYSAACASSDYLSKRAPIEALSDLGQHDCLTLVNATLGAEVWPADGPDGAEVPGVHGVFRVNSPVSMVAALEAGMGVGLLPIYAAIEPLRSGRIQRVLSAYRFRKVGVFQIYPSRKYVDATLRSWVQHVRDDLEGAFERDERAFHELTCTSVG